MPRESEAYRRIIERPATPGALSADQLSSAFAEQSKLSGILSHEEKAAENAAAFTKLVEAANRYGLDLDEVRSALPEVVEQLQIEADVMARGQHEKKRQDTKWYHIPRQIGLRWQEMLETFGSGKIAADAKAQRVRRLQDPNYIATVTEAALERASMRKRFNQYLELGGDFLKTAVKDFSKGTLEKGRLYSSDDFVHNEHLKDGVKQIAAQLEIPVEEVEPGKPKQYVLERDAAGNPTASVELTPENEAMIRKHIQFILRDEIVQLAQLNAMKVMTTEQYQVESTKLGVMGWKIAGSGTVWGFLARTLFKGAVTKLVVGGWVAGLTIASIPVSGAVLIAGGAGVLAGGVSQFAQYHGARRKQRKIDLAVGGQRAEFKLLHDKGSIEVSKAAEDIKQDLNAKTEQLEQIMAQFKAAPDAGDEQHALTDTLRQAINVTYTAIVDTEFRLLQSRLGKEHQDYINFGLDDRLTAQRTVLHAVREANQTMRAAMTAFPETTQNTIRDGFVPIAKRTQENIQELERHLGKILSSGEVLRVAVGAVIGGTFAGLTSAAMEYIGTHWFASRGIDVRQPPTFPEKGGKDFVYNGHNIQIGCQDDNHLFIIDLDRHVQLPPVEIPPGIDIHKVVLDDQLHFYDAATGKPLGKGLEIHLTDAVGYLKEKILTPNLSPGDNEVITVDGKQFDFVLDRAGNLAIYAMKPDGTVDLSHPLHNTPINLFSRELQQDITAQVWAEQAKTAELIGQFRVVEPRHGEFTIQSAYDQSVVADFKIDVSHEAVTPAATPAEVMSGSSGTSTSTSLLERLWADANNPVTKLLKTMGVDQGDIKTNPDGTFTIPDDAVKGDYLGKTSSWRQHRLELLLEAYQQGKIKPDESAQMVLARLERATRHIVLEHSKYPSHADALKEAFGREAGFIQKAEVPYINGTVPGPHAPEYPGVGKQWPELIDALRKLSTEATQPVPGAGAAGETAARTAAETANASDIVTHALELKNIERPRSDFGQTALHNLPPTTGDEEIFDTVKQTLAYFGAAALAYALDQSRIGRTHLVGNVKFAPQVEVKPTPEEAVTEKAKPPKPHKESTRETAGKSGEGPVTEALPTLEAEVQRFIRDMEMIDYKLERPSALATVFTALRKSWRMNQMTLRGPHQFETQAKEIMHNIDNAIADVRKNVTRVGIQNQRIHGGYSITEQLDYLQKKIDRSYKQEFQDRIWARDRERLTQQIRLINKYIHDQDLDRYNTIESAAAIAEIDDALRDFEFYDDELTLLEENLSLLDGNRDVVQFALTENRNARASIHNQCEKLLAKRAEIASRVPAAVAEPDEAPTEETKTTIVSPAAPAPEEAVTEPAAKVPLPEDLAAEAMEEEVDEWWREDVLDRAAARQRLAESAKTQSRIGAVDPDVAARWMHQYKGHEDVLKVLVDEFANAGILDSFHLRKFNNHFNEISDLGAARLRRAHFLRDDNTPNFHSIRDVVLFFKENLDSSPF